LEVKENKYLMFSVLQFQY